MRPHLNYLKMKNLFPGYLLQIKVKFKYLVKNIQVLKMNIQMNGPATQIQLK